MERTKAPSTSRNRPVSLAKSVIESWITVRIQKDQRHKVKGHLKPPTCIAISPLGVHLSKGPRAVGLVFAK
jgi:hypothetical protein